MAEHIFDIDDIDKQIMVKMQENPEITHSQIAESLGRSQPAIGARIKKLKDQGLIVPKIGVDFTNQHVAQVLKLVMVRIVAKKTEEIFQIAHSCPYVINVLKTGAISNLIVFIACSSLQRIDYIVDSHFRSKPYVQRLDLDVIMDIANPLVFPVDFVVEDFNQVGERCAAPDDSCYQGNPPEPGPVIIAVKKKFNRHPVKKEANA